MKRMISVLAFLLTLALPFTAFAADSTVSFENGSVIAFAPGSAHTSTDIFDNFKNVMPGDVLPETVTIQNQNTEFDYVKVYLRALPHDEENEPLADVTSDLSNEFLSKLSMQVWNGADLIYSDSPDQPDGLSERVYLGQIAAGETIELAVELTVPSDLGNDFANRIGEVDWEFIFEGFDVDVLTVRKNWTGDTANHPSEVVVNLLKDGEVEDTQTLSDENQWVYTWANLDQDFAWSVEEVKIDGYTSTMTKEGNEVLITNHKPIPEPPKPEARDLTVVKQWDNKGKDGHPNSATMTLYNGDRAVESVTLSASNNWTHTWKDLAGDDNWQVVETNINSNYVPIYAKDGDVVTVTNTQKLIQTGQLSWPIPVLGGLGALLILYGIFTARKKRKENAA